MAGVSTPSLVVLLLVVASASAQTDQTGVTGAFGRDVVDAVISRIESSCQLSQLWDTVYTSFLLRRIAYVESRDGTDRDTFRQSYDGGIWQVNQSAFLETQTPPFSDVQSRIQSDFNISWTRATWSDLRKPLYSALAAGIYLEIFRSGLVSSDIRVQALFWAMNYHDRGDVDRDPNRFVDRINQYEMGENCIIQADVMFVLDSSGSIDEDSYAQVRQFAYNFTNELITNENISQDRNRVGVIIFAREAYREIDFDTYESEVSLLNAIANIRHLRGRTNTADALCQLRTVDWRPGVLQLAVLMTDGMSNEPSPNCNGSTIEVAEQFHMDFPQVLIYVIGVTQDVNDTELLAIASTQNAVEYLDSFQASSLQTSQQTQNYQFCNRASIPAVEGNALSTSLTRGGSMRYQFVAMENITIRLCIFDGSIQAYFAFDIPNPNSARHHRMIELEAFQQNLRCAAVQLEPPPVSQDCMNVVPNSGRKRRQADEGNSFTVFVLIEGTAENSTSLSINSSAEGELFGTCGLDLCTNAECTDTLTSYECGDCLPGFKMNSDNECQAGLTETERIIVIVVVVTVGMVLIIALVLIAIIIGTRWRKKNQYKEKNTEDAGDIKEQAAQYY